MALAVRVGDITFYKAVSLHVTDFRRLYSSTRVQYQRIHCVGESPEYLYSVR